MRHNDHTYFKFVDLDFRPAPPGWTAYFLEDDEPDFCSSPIAGWLVQAETQYSSFGHEPVEDQPPLTERPRQVVPAEMDEETGLVEDVTLISNFWEVRAPGRPAPTEEETREAWTRKRNLREAMARKRPEARP